MREKPEKLKTKLPKNVSVDFDRHGNMRLYFRRVGQTGKIRIKEMPGTPAFDKEVACARLGIPYEAEGGAAPPVMAASISRTVKKDSFEWLAREYKGRIGNQINAGLFGRRARLFDEICESKMDDIRRGALPYKLMERRHVAEIRDELRDTPGARNHVVASISALFSWAIENGLAENNPAFKIKKFKVGKETHTWTIDEIRQYEAAHPTGSSARLMLHMAMFTGLRLQELAILGRQHISDGWLSIRPGKTKMSSGAVVEIPVLPDLATALASARSGNMTFLVTEFGKPFSVNGLGNKMRDWCDQAGLFHCSTHGLRKAGATIAAENGATDEQLMAIFGWTTKKQTSIYTAKANRKRMAREGIHHLMPEQKSDKIVPPDQVVEKSGAIQRKKLSNSKP